MTRRGPALRFDAAAHAYYLDGVRVPSVTQMLHADGKIDTTWYTEESRIRGSAVHAWTAAYDMDAADVDAVEGLYRGYCLAHVEAMRVLRPDVLRIEEAWAHTGFRYGGRLDRVWRLFGAITIAELKTGGFQEWHRIQTALQAIIAEEELGVPARALKRVSLHLQSDGRFTLEAHEDAIDFAWAKNVIARHACRREPWVPAEVW